MTAETQPIILPEDIPSQAPVTLIEWISENDVKGFTSVSSDSITEQPAPLTPAQKRENMIKDVAHEVRASFDYDQNMTEGLRVENAARRAAEIILDRINKTPVKRGQQ